MKTELIKHNLYAKIVNGKVQELIMPNTLGVLEQESPGKLNWYAIKWPVNPNFTGEHSIINIIENGFPTKQKV